MERALLRELRVDGTGLDRDDADAEGRGLDSQRVGHRFDGVLGSAVGRGERDAQPPAQRRHQDDRPSAGLAHGREDRAGHVQHAEEIDVEDGAPFLRGDFLDGAVLRVARVVDEGVDAPRPRERLAHGRSNRRRIGDVEGERGEIRGTLQLREVVAVTGGGEDAMAAAGGFERRRAPDPGRAARHQDHSRGGHGRMLPLRGMAANGSENEGCSHGPVRSKSGERRKPAGLEIVYTSCLPSR